MEPDAKLQYLRTAVEHIDIKQFDAVPLVEAMGRMAYSARDLARAAKILNRMISDPDCGIILCLAGSLVSDMVIKTMSSWRRLPERLWRCRNGKLRR